MERKHRNCKRSAGTYRVVVCRICGSSLPGEPIFPDRGQHLAEKMCLVFGCMVSEDDSAPNRICYHCLLILHYVYGYLMSILRGDSEEYLSRPSPFDRH